MDSLATLYRELDFQGGDLLCATAVPPPRLSRENWIEKGEWLASAQRAGADSVFFVNNNPIIVFAECGQELAEKVKAFNRVWSLARPRILFLASPGEITVYDLAQKPVDINDAKSWKKLRHLEVLEDLSKAASQLHDFHRDNIESGRVFGDERFGNLNDRADKALIRDLKTVRRALMQDGLSGKKLRYAHSLIGRSIFICYLEDRGILTEDYFLSVARQTQGWTDLLRNPPARQGLDLTEIKTFFPKVLQDKDFTYAIFKRLSKDFNGDMFPDVETEYEIVEQNHLHRIQGLLYGDTQDQRQLFFHAYRFDIVPLDLISSIYEEFYHSSAEDEEAIAETKNKTSNKARNNGAYYTPPALAEFVLSRTLTPETLKKHPRVLDPACGSGIFLVEAFRRMVRYERHKKQKSLTFDELKNILRDQIAGIEVNEEAARITAFSLYLAMLHYLDPPAIREHIRQGNKLPGLLASRTNTSPNCFHSILCANSFDVDHIKSTSRWRERFGDECADIVVGNPPWGKPGPKADPETKACQKTLLAWCHDNGRPIGDKEPSQAFLWRALDFLKSGGKAGMLVSAGVLFKHGTTTQDFRRQWLSEVKLREVFNFAHVRKFFFTGGTSPFISVFFEKGQQEDTPVYYWSAKQLAEIKKTQAVLLSQHDLNILRDVDLASGSTWKTLWLEPHNSLIFRRVLSSRCSALNEFVDRNQSGRGYNIGSQDNSAAELQQMQSIVPASFSRYDPLRLEPPPQKVERLRSIDLYRGSRILVGRGIRQKGTDKGYVDARYEEAELCFRHSLYAIRLLHPSSSTYSLLLGIMWSSLARWNLFCSSSNWGLWHDEIHFDDELLELPVVFDKTHPATQRVVRIVDKLRDYYPHVRDLQHPHGVSEATIQRKRRQWEQQLDEAVFDLYDLTEEQRDLIRDCCEVTLPFFYKPFDSIGADLAISTNGDLQWMEQYTRIFARRWNAYLPDDQEMRADLHVGAHDNMVAVEFYPADKGDSWDLTPRDDWQYVLDQLAEKLPQPMGTSQIVLDGLVYAVSEDAIIIIKRNLKRLWTRSLAREDADSTICKAMVQSRDEQGKAK